MAKKAAPKNTNIVTQGAKFGVVGISNTVIDYTIFTAVTGLFNIPLQSVYLVKYLSGSVAMVNSFYWNRRWVFRSQAGIGKSGVRFLIATLVSVYLIQPNVVRLFTATSFKAFGIFWFNVAHAIGLVGLVPHILTSSFVIKTVAFACGVLGSAIWNFTLYKLWAFKND